MKRREARKHIFNLVFQNEFNNDTNVGDVIETYREEYEDFPEGEREFISREFRGILANVESIDSYIDKYAVGWSVKRLGKAELAILRIGVYEVVFDSEIPDAVAVNEAVELAKTFAADKAPAFVNAVLSKIVRSKEVD